MERSMRRKEKGRGKAVLASTRLHGKDAKLAAAVREANKEQAGSDQESSFDAKKVGRKAVFRPVLSSPFNVPLHNITPLQADIILHSLLDLLKGVEVRQYFKRENKITPRPSSRKTKEKNKRRRIKMAIEVLKQHGIHVNPKSDTKDQNPPDTEKPGQKKPFLCGLNSITRALEAHIRGNLSGEPSSSNSIAHVPKYIFLCGEDVDPTTLVSHLPLLISTFNAVLKKDCMLVRLPAGSEAQICEAVELRRCSVISIDDDDNAVFAAEGSQARLAIDSLRDKMVAAGCKAKRLEWLDEAVECLQRGNTGYAGGGARTLPMLDPQVKHFRSSAPLDMNAVKATKKSERGERKKVKGERKEKLQDRGPVPEVQRTKPLKIDPSTMTKAEKIERRTELKLKRKADKAAG